MADAQLRGHARLCQRCDIQLQTWLRIGEVIQPARCDSPAASSIATHRARLRAPQRLLEAGLGKRPALVSLLAAAAALLFTWLAPANNQNKLPLAQHQAATGDSGSHAEPASQSRSTDPLGLTVLTEPDPSHWWREVQTQQWVDETMPAVHSVRAGVAPLGRSLMRAVTILTIGGNDQTS